MKINGISQKPNFLLQESGATQFQRDLLPGFYSGVWVYFYGTNNSGQTVAHSDFTLQVQHQGRQIINIDGDRLKEINNQEGGYVDSASVAAGAFALAAFIPFTFGDIQNCLRVVPGGNTTITWIPKSTYATKVSTGTVEIYPIEGDAVQNYIPNLLPYDLASFSGTQRDRLPFSNIKEIWLKGANLTQIQIERDGKQEFNGNNAAMVSLTSYLSALEAGAATYVHINFGERPTDYVSRSVNFQLTNSSAATAVMQVLSFDFNTAETQQSIQVRANEVSNRLNTVPNSGKALPILKAASVRAVAE